MKIAHRRRFAGLPAAMLSLVIAGGVQAAQPGAEPRKPATGVFATEAGASAARAVPGAAAIVDGHVIPMSDVVSRCLITDRSYVIDQIVQQYVIDRECQRRGLHVSESDIDAHIADLRKQFAPASLESTLAEHHWTMEQLRAEYRRKIATPMLVADQVKPVAMAHCQEILVKCLRDDGSAPGPGVTRSAAEGLAAMQQIQDKLRAGKDFADIAAQHDPAPGGKSDLGVLYANMMDVEAPVLTAAVSLRAGETTPMPIRTANGYCLLRAISTSATHPASEDAAYADADAASRKLQIQFLGPKLVGDLIDKSHRTYVSDADLAAGKPLPRVAATIDGHEIPMQEVLAKCLDEVGPNTIDILVQNYVVDRECQRRGITVAPSEVDADVERLRNQMAPHPLSEGLALHHTTMAGLRRDFRQQIERTKLAMDQVPPERMVHARAVVIKDTAGAGMPSAEATAMQFRNQLIQGGDFAELAKNCAASGRTTLAGDIGILYPGMQNRDTTLLTTALAMHRGQATPAPIHVLDGWLLLQVISSSDDHDPAENAAYAAALRAYREQEAQRLVPQTILALLKSAKIVYFVHR